LAFPCRAYPLVYLRFFRFLYFLAASDVPAFWAV
jgi:hypothetical protein